jgi:hypothetical protein
MMKANLFVTFTVSLLAIYTIEVDSRAVLYGGKGPNMIEGEYIIVLHGNISKEACMLFHFQVLFWLNTIVPLIYS